MKKITVAVATAFAILLADCSKKADGLTPLPATEDALAATTTAVCNVTKATADSLNIFPGDNAWHKDISTAAVDPFNRQIIAKFATSPLHPDFGSGLIDGKTFGFPFTVVCGSQPKVAIVYRANSIDGNFGSESDKGPFPIPLDAPIEQGGDGHVIVVDKDHKMLYELYNANVKSGHWEASSGAKFNLRSDSLRPDGFTSADAAGLPIFAGLVRYDEISKGVINHAIRFTLARGNTLAAHIFPARHEGNGSGKVHFALPFGARIRLKASFNISSYSTRNKVILTALKKYGIILADIGSNMYISGSQDNRWNNDELHQLTKLKGSDFEVVKFNP